MAGTVVAFHVHYKQSKVCSASHRALWHNLFSELSEGNSSILVFVHFLDNFGCFLLTDIEATRLDKALELLARNTAAIILVKRVESLIDIEIGHALEFLTSALGGNLTSEVGSPDSAELELSVRLVAVIASI